MLMLLQNSSIHVIAWKNETVSFSNWSFVKERQNVLFNRKDLKDKCSDLTQLRFSGKLFIKESKPHENQQLAYRCRQLKTASKIHFTWLFNNTVNLKITDPFHKISHIDDSEKILGVDHLDEYGNNSSF